jgi:hypothetical protein
MKTVNVDKITMINLVWMAMITTMLTATVALYENNFDKTSSSISPISARFASYDQ